MSQPLVSLSAPAGEDYTEFADLLAGSGPGPEQVAVDAAGSRELG